MAGDVDQDVLNRCWRGVFDFVLWHGMANNQNSGLPYAAFSPREF
jgi:hypothetical protein